MAFAGLAAVSVVFESAAGCCACDWGESFCCAEIAPHDAISNREAVSKAPILPLNTFTITTFLLRHTATGSIATSKCSLQSSPTFQSQQLFGRWLQAARPPHASP